MTLSAMFNVVFIWQTISIIWTYVNKVVAAVLEDRDQPSPVSRPSVVESSVCNSSPVRSRPFCREPTQ